MNPSPPSDSLDRLDELLADRAVFGLASEERSELESLLADGATHSAADAGGYDRIAAAVFLAEAPVETEAMPPALRERLTSQAAAFDFRATPRVVSLQRRDAAASWRDRSAGVMFAVAASVMLAVGLSILYSPPSAPPIIARNALMAEADDVVRLAWADPADADADGLGDVVWSDSRQEGYMRFEGLAANDPREEQYQLWVFDADRDDRYPVDGGVFDIASDGEAVVRIEAKLPVSRATMFAITIERPGGVVVSDRSRLPLLAQR